MLTIRNLHSWSPMSFAQFLQLDAAMMKLAKQEFKEEFEDFASINGSLSENTSEDEVFEDFLHNLDGYETEYDSFERILLAYIKAEKLQAVYFDAYMDADDDDYWHVSIAQVIPTDKEDLKELLGVYLKETSNETLTELVTDGFLKKLQE